VKSLIVSVDYSDILSISLPYNRHHFSDVLIVTSPADETTVGDIARKSNASLFVTDLFYANGAIFNKWAPLESGLDKLGRDGWIALLDADVLWPKVLPSLSLEIGNLYGPVRRMYPKIPQNFDQIPTESDWTKYPIHRNLAEIAGYTQVFHADDPVLGPPPWHDTSWTHAGGSDSFFQAKWPNSRKVRPPFEVLHMGTPGANWCGRATPYADGTVPPESGKRAAMVGNIWEKRSQLRKAGRDQFEGERGA
jgi:hypothetical protein